METNDDTLYTNEAVEEITDQSNQPVDVPSELEGLCKAACCCFI